MTVNIIFCSVNGSWHCGPFVNIVWRWFSQKCNKPSSPHTGKLQETQNCQREINIMPFCSTTLKKSLESCGWFERESAGTGGMPISNPVTPDVKWDDLMTVTLVYIYKKSYKCSKSQKAYARHNLWGYIYDFIIKVTNQWESAGWSFYH